jgi:DNA-binding response OmpR family regulator
MSDERGKVRVLLVDDDPEIREAVGWLLEDEGYDVVTAADGQQALDCVSDARPDLILLDIGLPILTGEEVAAELRAQSIAPPPIVVMTAAGSVVDKSRRVGAVGYVAKPFDLDHLVHVVRRALGK